MIDETHTICAGPGGYTKRYGLEPDLLTIGKTLGAGVPSAAYGMTQGVADRVVAGTFWHEADIGGVGGTLAGNALSLAAMRATLGEVLTDEAFDRMEELAIRFTDGVQDVIAAPRAAVAHRAPRLPRRVPVPPEPRAGRRRGRRRPGRGARRLHPPVPAQPRRAADAVPQHGADVAGHDDRGRRPAHGGVRRGRRRPWSTRRPRRSPDRPSTRGPAVAGILSSHGRPPTIDRPLCPAAEGAATGYAKRGVRYAESARGVVLDRGDVRPGRRGVGRGHSHARGRRTGEPVQRRRATPTGSSGAPTPREGPGTTMRSLAPSPGKRPTG